nr:olfactory receptor 45 [Tropidothorax elegans]
MSSLRFYTSYRTVIKMARRSGLPMPWKEEDESSFTTVLFICYQIFVGLFLVWKQICVIYAIGHNDKIQDVIFSCAMLMYTMNGTCQMFVYIIWGRDLKILTDNMDRLCKKIQESPLRKKAYFRKLNTSDARNICKFCKIITSITLMCPVNVLIIPILAYIEGKYGEKFGHPTHCRYEFQFYEIFVLAEYMSLAYPALFKLGNEFIMIGLFKVHTSYFKFLSAALYKIIDETNSDMPSNSKEKFLSWINLHQDVIRSSTDMIAFFSPGIVLYYFSTIGVVGGCVFYQLNTPDPFLSLFMGMYMVITIIQLYIQCHMADEVITEAENLANVVYEMPWYAMDYQTRIAVQTVILMANRSISIKAYKSPAFTMNRDAFIKFMSNIISACMGFSKIMELDDL